MILWLLCRTFLTVTAFLLCRADLEISNDIASETDVTLRSSRTLLSKGARVSGVMSLQTATALDDAQQLSLRRGMGKITGMPAESVTLITSRQLSPDTVAIVYEIDQIGKTPGTLAASLLQKFQSGSVCQSLVDEGLPMKCSSVSHPRAWNDVGTVEQPYSSKDEVGMALAIGMSVGCFVAVVLSSLAIFRWQCIERFDVWWDDDNDPTFTFPDFKSGPGEATSESNDNGNNTNQAYTDKNPPPRGPGADTSLGDGLGLGRINYAEEKKKMNQSPRNVNASSGDMQSDDQSRPSVHPAMQNSTPHHTHHNSDQAALNFGTPDVLGPQPPNGMRTVRKASGFGSKFGASVGLNGLESPYVGEQGGATKIIEKDAGVRDAAQLMQGDALDQMLAVAKAQHNNFNSSSNNNNNHNNPPTAVDNHAHDTTSRTSKKPASLSDVGPASPPHQRPFATPNLGDTGVSTNTPSGQRNADTPRESGGGKILFGMDSMLPISSVDDELTKGSATQGATTQSATAAQSPAMAYTLYAHRNAASFALLRSSGIMGNSAQGNAPEDDNDWWKDDSTPRPSPVRVPNSARPPLHGTKGRDKIMNMHNELFAGRGSGGMTEMLSLPGDKTASPLYQGAHSLTGRMLDANSDHVPLSARVQRQAPQLREEDQMWG